MWEIITKCFVEDLYDDTISTDNHFIDLYIEIVLLVELSLHDIFTSGSENIFYYLKKNHEINN